MKKAAILFLHGDIFDFDDDKYKIDYFINYFKLQNKYNRDDFIWDETNPKYVFVSEHLYYGKNNDLVRKKFLEIQNDSFISIFIAGECIEPDLNLFDYAIIFDRDLKLNDRIIRLPFFVKFYKTVFNKKNIIKDKKTAMEELRKKKKFCNFIYSNGNAIDMRDRLFFEISKYKKVDSLGSHLRNVYEFDEELLKISDWRLQSIKYKELYKFSIASENASYNGYVSEKLFTSFQAHSIPIYFGDPDVYKDFNSKAFINFHDFENMKDMIDYIKKVDNNNELWTNIIKEPWCTDEQYKNHKKVEKKYYDFIKRIFNSDINELHRKPVGFHPNNYRENIFSNNIIIEKSKKESFLRTLIRRIVPFNIRNRIKSILKK